MENLINRSTAPKGYESVEDFLKVVDDSTIKEYGYDSIEEFIHKNKRYPNIEESKKLYSLLWNHYISNLDHKGKRIALQNNSLTNQSEVITRLRLSIEKFKDLMKGKKDVVLIWCYERWGMHKIFVDINCSNKEALYKFRKDIPIFFEGWEVALFQAKPINRMIFIVKQRLSNIIKPCRLR